jgi:hypothetical protein
MFCSGRSETSKKLVATINSEVISAALHEEKTMQFLFFD